MTTTGGDRAAPAAVGPIVPPSTIGMLGGGQLGKYALVAANAMGYRTIVLDPSDGAPAGVVADDHLVAAYDDPGALDALASRCAVVTTEFENAPAAALERLGREVRVAPSPAAVAIAQDRIAEKGFLGGHRFPVGDHVALAHDATDDVRRRAVALAERGAVVKTARLGYDGRGQRRATGAHGLDVALAELGGVDCVVEAALDLIGELSVLVARTHAGDVTTWAVAENVHVDGILDVSVVPARCDEELSRGAVELAVEVAEALDFVGVVAVELFVVADGAGNGRLLVNEIAPRPHNSGHWTLDASVTSQFEQQIRAVCGVGLADVAMTAPAIAMVNLLGDLWFVGETVDGRADPSRTPGGADPADRAAVEPRWERALAHPAAALHLYGKDRARPGRKMGHLTVTGDDPGVAAAAAVALRASLTGGREVRD
ncbi:5-(carboxyamino)imidazole ribonucleotide synthase [Ilumatobacter sp.]|uniref:5-(carboxyamino)imidazole ribonucleotide synthase n=1 Tax=Ilumatobacter sp. TaxID=1967498 RepID=UPI003B51FAD2